MEDSSNGSNIVPPDLPTSQYNLPDEPDLADEDSAIDVQDFTTAWTGPDFVAHDKSASWYSAAFVTAVVIGAVFYLLTKDVITSVTAFLAIFVIGFYSLRKPKMIEFKIDTDGFNKGPKRYGYDEFRSFRALPEGDYMSATFIPFKRFAPPVGICYKGSQEEEILTFLATRLPYEQHQPDILERLLLSIHF